jgi:hypothetical protein
MMYQPLTEHQVNPAALSTELPGGPSLLCGTGGPSLLCGTRSDVLSHSDVQPRISRAWCAGVSKAGWLAGVHPLLCTVLAGLE